ncbi:hypothetical protein MHYP_G00222870 [Metynnis hypsauchen]
MEEEKMQIDAVWEDGWVFLSGGENPHYCSHKSPQTSKQQTRSFWTQFLSARGMDWLCSRTFLPFLLVFTVGVTVKSAIQDTDKPLIPATVEACSGLSATINCTFQINATLSVVNWYFSETPDFSESKKIEMPDEQYHQEKGETWSSLTIKEVLSNDSGWYFCMVIQHIPQLKQYYSHGSRLIIINSTTGIDQVPNTTTAASTMCAVTTPGPSSSESSAWLLWTALTMVCVVLVFVIVTIWNIFRRRRASPIYENTHAYQKDRSPCPSKSVEKGNLTKQRDPLRSHYTSHPKGRQRNS